MDNTLAYFEQTNDFKTDRRFIYLQHSNSFIFNTRIFLSTEIDLFKKELGERQGDFSLTSLFISTNIRPGKIFSLYLWLWRSFLSKFRIKYQLQLKL